MPRIADPIHEAQGGSGKKTVARVVLEDDGAAGDAGGLAQKTQRVWRMVQNVDEKDAINTPVTLWEGVAVETINGDVGVRTDEHIESAQLQVRTKFENAVGDEAVPAADIKHAGTWWEDLGEMGAEHAHAALKDMATVEGVEERHGRISAGCRRAAGPWRAQCA